MVEATHTSEAMYGLSPNIGRGPKMFAAKITVSDAETIDTGFDTIEGMGAVEVEATNIDALSPLVAVSGVSAGTITFVVGAIGAYGDLTDEVAWLIVVGSVR